MNIMRLKTKLARLNLTAAAKKSAAMKAEFRREDQELYRQGKAMDVLRKNAGAMGIDSGRKGRLVGFNGVRFE